MKRLVLPILLVLSLLLAACSPLQSNGYKTVPTTAPASSNSNTLPVSTGQENSELTRTDEQGAVTFEVTPVNLSKAADSLEFDVSMNTHSVDLSMDLAQLATLTTDTGLTIQASKWDATPGGHHVPGKLIFPVTQDGKSVLDGAGKLTLTIVNVDVPSRVFEWPLQ
jgi:hypothetical protein